VFVEVGCSGTDSLPPVRSGGDLDVFSTPVGLGERLNAVCPLQSSSGDLFLVGLRLRFSVCSADLFPCLLDKGKTSGDFSL
jgi:hypothetical protein